jgi:hypothetical protein
MSRFARHERVETSPSEIFRLDTSTRVTRVARCHTEMAKSVGTNGYTLSTPSNFMIYVCLALGLIFFEHERGAANRELDYLVSLASDYIVYYSS